MLFLLGVLLPMATLRCSSGESLPILPRLLNEIQEKTKPVADLRRLLDEDREDSSDIDKRTCHFRLGNPCLTQTYDRADTEYRYLKSPYSPGRRRRQAANHQQF